MLLFGYKNDNKNANETSYLPCHSVRNVITRLITDILLYVHALIKFVDVLV